MCTMVLWCRAAFLIRRRAYCAVFFIRKTWKKIKIFYVWRIFLGWHKKYLRDFRKYSWKVTENEREIQFWSVKYIFFSPAAGYNEGKYNRLYQNQSNLAKILPEARDFFFGNPQNPAEAREMFLGFLAIYRGGQKVAVNKSTEIFKFGEIL